MTTSAPATAFAVRASRTTEVRVGPGAIAELGDRLRGRPARLVADPFALELHGASLPTGLVRDALLVPRGESAKTWTALGALLEQLAASGLDRDGVVVAFGGGATSDVAGLAAALHLRGVAWIAVPTTLLAQVDAALGGKTAVDLAAGKNLVGAFHAPEALLADPAPLATLPDGEVASGLGEVLKVALGLDVELWRRLERDAPGIRRGGAGALAALVPPCLFAKARLVEEDEFERGPRAALNLGHTLAHAIERVAGYGRVPHGIAVAVGLAFATRVADDAGVLEERDLPHRLRELADALGLPPDLASLERSIGPLDDARLLAAMSLDKKARGGRPRFVLPRGLGRLSLGVDVAPERLARLLAERDPA